MASHLDLSWGYVALIVLFAGIFVALLVRLARENPTTSRSQATAAPPPPATSGTLAEAMAVPGAVADPYVLRFVTDEQGERVGETLAMSGDRVIVKRETGFFALPLASVTLQGDELRVSGVDWDAAKRDGEAWRTAQAADRAPIRTDEQGNVIEE